MKRILLSLVLAVTPALALVGCSDEAGTKETTTVTTPGGTTTTTQETKVESSGDNPPPAPAPTP